jgi:hypothetical protein
MLELPKKNKLQKKIPKKMKRKSPTIFQINPTGGVFAPFILLKITTRDAVCRARGRRARGCGQRRVVRACCVRERAM